MADDSDIIIQATFKYTEDGADEVIASNQAVEQSAADMSKSVEQASGGFTAIGEASSKAASGMSEAAGGFAKIEESTGGIAKGADEAASGIVEVGTSSAKAAQGADAAVAAFLGIGASTGNISKNAGAAAGGMAAVGTSSSQAAQDADAAVAAFLGLDKSSQSAATGIAASGKAAEEAGGGFNLFSMNGMMMVMMIMQIAQVVGQMLGALAKATDATEGTARAFEYLTGDATKAQAELSSLHNTWAAAAFSTQGIDNVAQHLLMSGESADTANKQITRVSDAIAAMGGSAQQIQPVIDKLNSISTETKVTTQDMQQLVDQGLPAWDALAAGMSSADGKLVSVAEAQKRVNEGAVSGKQAYQDMMQGMIQYTGAAEAQSNSLGAEWTRLGENAAKAFKPIADWLAKDLEAINELMEGTSQLNSALQSLGNLMQSLGSPITAHYATGIMNSPVGHFAEVGENGPETMFIPAGASIFPNGSGPFDGGGGSSIPSLSSMMSSGDSGGSGGQPIVIIAQLHVDGRQMAQTTIPYVAPMVRALIGGKQ